MCVLYISYFSLRYVIIFIRIYVVEAVFFLTSVLMSLSFCSYG